MKSSKKTTISDIARETGYSKTTVSFAFNSPSRISQEARDKILEVAKRLEYTPDPMARNFSLGRHKSIGFLLPQSLSDSLSNPYTQSVLRGIGIVAERNDYTLTIIPPVHSSISEAINNATVDGLISMGLWFDPQIRESLRRRKLPLVLIDGADEDGPINLSIDDMSAAYEEMKAVLEKGHRKIAVISLPFDAYAQLTPQETKTIVRRRQAGYEKALSEYNMSLKDINIVSCLATFQDGSRVAADFFENGDYTCIVCMSDVVALGVIDMARAVGKSVPEDVSVVGFDGIFSTYSSGLCLTTVVQDAEKKGIMSAELLFKVLEGEDVESHHSFPFEFREGNTLKEI